MNGVERELSDFEAQVVINRAQARRLEEQEAEIERLRQWIAVLEGTAYLNAQPTQQEVRQAMGAAYAADAPGRVQSPLVNGA